MRSWRVSSSTARSLALIAALMSPLAVAAPDGQQLMRTSDELHRLPAELLKANMRLESEQGDQRALSFEMVRVREKSGDKTRLRFAAPADIKGMTLLTLAPTQGDDEQWLYLPSFKKTRRIGGSELGDRFAGSDLFYEDLRQRPVDDFTYKFLKTESYRGFDCHLVEGTPANEAIAKESPYGKRQVWLRADILAPLRVRMFDRQLKPVKELQYDNLKQLGPKAWQPDLMTVVDVQRKHRTIVTVEKRETRIAPGPETFSQHLLAAE
jgi:hypothetical protein